MKRYSIAFYISTEAAMKASESAREITEIIKKALERHEITTEEYESILIIADRDGHIDPQERAAISDLRDMISDKTIRIVPKKD
jgi:tellurite resistance protein